MDGCRATVRGLAVVLALGVLPAAPADLADVHLRNGLRLRGDVTDTGAEILLRNEAGTVRLARADVLRIVPLPLTATRPVPVTPPATRPAPLGGPTLPPVPRTPTGPQPAAAPQPAEPAPETAPETAPAEEHEGLAPAPPLSKRDIQRLRLRELVLDGAPELVRVNFLKRGNQKDLPLQVLEELRKRPDFDPRWEDTLTRGQAHEKLQLIVRETGLRHADRIEILSDPEAFTQFRKRVLPLVNKSCARSGCHAGTAARVFRLPVGSKTGESYAYTTFVLLDQMEGAHGELINRSNPEDSLLATYLLPPEVTDKPHPPVKRGPSLRPVIWGRDDPQYSELLNWIGFLVVPRPDYGLEYRNPYAGRVGEGEAPATAPAAEPSAPDMDAPPRPSAPATAPAAVPG